MAQDNQVVIVGNLTRDPELRYTPNGAALVKFGVAVSRRGSCTPPVVAPTFIHRS